MKKCNIECPYCGENSEVYFVTQKTSMEIKNQVVEYQESFYRCEACDEEFEVGKCINDNLLAVRDAYRKKNKLLTSSQIAEIRKKYNLSQADFSLALGWGEITITRYETKQIQDSTYDMILRMVKSNPFMLLQLLEKNKNNFTEEKYKTIEENIRGTIKENIIQEMDIDRIKDTYALYDEPSQENGYVVLDVKKLNNIIGTILSKTDCMYKVQLMKTLWYIDYLHYEETGKSATGLVYERKRMGALPICNNELISLPAVFSEVEYYENGNMGYRLSVADDFTPLKISKTLEDIIDRVVKKFKRKSSKEIVEYMHKEDAYLKTFENEVIPFSKEYKLRKF